MNTQEAYLVGLICARGHLFESGKKIIIEFAHKNKTIDGIAYCPKCGDMATLKKKDNLDGDLFCKSCGGKVDKRVKKTYEQQESTVNSIKEVIIPFLNEKYKAKYDIVGNDHMTLLVIELDIKDFSEIFSLFNGKTSFDSFEIPNQIYDAPNDLKKEFIGGLLDTAGFFNAGGWLNRPGINGTGRMRAYFQIVRNWKMPVQICNLLKHEFNLPIHTIDWGHPNIRDSNMKDYYDSNPLSWSREHQLKFFPEYYEEFPIRISHKNEMFKELVNHNKKVIFSTKDDCAPPSPISLNKVKAYHFGENDARIPHQSRVHCDAYWQVCHNMGCIYSNEIISNSENKDYYYLTGKDENGDLLEIRKEYEQQRQYLKRKIIDNNVNKEKIKEQNAIKQNRSNPEQQLYEPISKWLEKCLGETYTGKILVHDTSAFYLDKFIAQNNLFDAYDFCNEYKIKPDIVGFLFDNKEIVFVEVKIEELTLKNIGQLLGYSLVGMPKLSILISTKKPSINLVKTLKANPSILNYLDRSIKIGYWNKDKCEFIGV